MLTFLGDSHLRFCRGVTRRNFLQAGALGLGGLSLADLLKLRARGGTGSPRSSSKAVIYVYLWGGPSHIDTYDMKPNAPLEIRGEFRPIRTNVPGFDICEYLPLQAQIADKLALVRNLRFNPNFHDPVELFSGFKKPTEAGFAARPDFGSVVSKLRSGAGPRQLPAYIALDKTAGYEFRNGPAYLGLAHKAFVPGDRLESLALPRNVSLERLQDRNALRSTFDQINRDIDANGVMDGLDAFNAQALEMVTSARTRDAFDISREPEAIRASYGEGEAQRLLMARRLVEAGVPVVTLTFGGVVPNAVCNNDSISATSWDTHNHGFPCLRAKLPRLDRAIRALITDIYARGLDQDVTVMIGGEMGRFPVVGRGGCGATPDGRGHWVYAGFSLISGGGLRMGQVIGRTDARGDHPVGVPYTPQNLLATLYHTLGIDLATTFPNHNGRPTHLLDNVEPIRELI